MGKVKIKRVFSMMTISAVLILVFILVSHPDASGENFGIGVHSGYGVFKYEEQTSAFGPNQEGKSVQNVVLFGVSGEYTFPKHENFFTGITTDWAFGLEDEERWYTNGNQIQTNDMRVFGQFYDFRLGYKDSLDNFYYRFYVSGGWDGLHFKRNDFVVRGRAVSGTVTEDFSLWRTGGGIGLGYKFSNWALDGRLSYAYYPKGSVDNSSYPDITFDTNGTCMDMGFGVAREVSKNMKFYVGVSYTLLELDQSDIKRSGSTLVVFPNSTTEMIFGVVNLTYAF